MKLFLFCCFVALFFYYPKSPSRQSPDDEIVLQGSTPGDSSIKAMLKIDQAKLVDFIRWNLTLHLAPNLKNTFELNISYGENEPNTLGFKNGGEKKQLKGTFGIFKVIKSTLRGEMYKLSAGDLGVAFSFVKLNDNLFQLLTTDDKLMVGNGGWSYCLNRKGGSTISSTLPALSPTVANLKPNRHIEIFDGRTPCTEIAKEYGISVNNECTKLKWRLTLYRDSLTMEPTGYTLLRIFRKDKDIVGKWEIIKGTSDNPAALIYRLLPKEKSDEALQFLVGDENVLFFLDKKQQLLVGDENFSFALNRKLK